MKRREKHSSIVILFTLVPLPEGPFVSGLNQDAICALPHPLKRQGTTQSERFTKELLDPEYYKLDERSWQNLLEQCYNLAPFINYFDANHLSNPVADWQPFFAEFMDAVNNKMNDGVYTRAQANQSIEPHLALLITFLQLFKYAQDDLNNVLQRYIKFYYTEVLQLKPKSAIADTVAVQFELNKNAVQVKIDKGSLLNAGKDSNGFKLVYATNDDLIVNQGKVEMLKALFLNGAGTAFKSFHAAQAINMGDYIAAPVIADPPSWPPYGNVTLPEVKLGFAVSAPVFSLPEGDRRITLTFKNSTSVASTDFLSLTNPFSVEFSSVKGWVPVSNVLLTAKNVMVIIIARGLPAFTAYNEEVHKMQLHDVTLPALKIYLQDSGRYVTLQHFVYSDIDIEVSVTGVHNLVLQNDLGILDSSKPFFPFTNQPTRESSAFYVGYPYAFNKYLRNFKFTGRWRNQPADIHSYFAAYTQSPMPGAMLDAQWQGFPLRDIHGQPYGLNAGNWMKMNLTVPIVDTDDTGQGSEYSMYDNFTSVGGPFSPAPPVMQQVGSLLGGVTGFNTTVEYAQAVLPGISQAIDPNIIETEVFNNLGPNGAVLFTNEIDTEAAPLYDVTVKDGFVKFVNGYDYGHTQYTNLLSTAVIKAQTEKVSGSNGIYVPARAGTISMSNNVITDVALESRGSGYVAKAPVSIKDLDGTGSWDDGYFNHDNGVLVPGLQPSLPPGAVYHKPVAIIGGGHRGIEATLAAPTIPSSGADNKKVTAINITSGGSGYMVAPSVVIVDTSGAGKGATARAKIDDGEIVSITIVAKGSNYNAATTRAILFSGGGQSNGGTAAIPATPVVPTTGTNAGKVMSIAVASGGSGYINPPSVTIVDTRATGALGTGARAEAVLTNGVVTKIVMKNKGSNYFNPIAIICGDFGGGGVLMPNVPYAPEIASIELSYKLGTSYRAANGMKSKLFYLHPFGVEMLSQQSINLLPLYSDEGNLYIGISSLHIASIISLYFKIHEGSGDKAIVIDSVKPKFSYLYGNSFIEMEQSSILKDTTDMLTNSGIMQISLPQQAISAHTVMPGNLVWIKVSIDKYSGGFPWIIDVWAQAVEATFVDNGHLSDHLKYPLPASSVKGMVHKVEGIKKVNQPYESQGGKMEESQNSFYTRVSERLRHKQRNWTMWDTERLVLEEFPFVYKVKCISHTNSLVEYAPGSIKVLVVPNLVNQSNQNKLQPGVSNSEMLKIKRFIQKHSSPFVKITIANPAYEQIKLDFGVSFKKQYADFSYYRQLLQNELIEHIAPWITDNNNGLTFSGVLYKSRLMNFIEDRYYVDYITSFTVIKIDMDGHSVVCDEEITCSNESVILTSSPVHNIHAGVC